VGPNDLVVAWKPIEFKTDPDFDRSSATEGFDFRKIRVDFARLE
jgi:hypothetical protein